MNTEYVQINDGDSFGAIDIILACFESDNTDEVNGTELNSLENWTTLYLRRQFTVRSSNEDHTDLL